MRQPTIPLSLVLLDIASNFVDDTIPIPQGVEQFLLQLDQSDIFITGYRLEDSEEGELLQLMLPPLLAEPIVFTLPALTQLALVFYPAALGDLPKIEVLNPFFAVDYLQLDDLRLALRLPREWLRPLDGSPYAELSYTGSIRFYPDWRVQLVDDPSLMLPPCEIANTGITLSLIGVQFDFSTEYNTPGIDALELPPTFRGIYGRSASVEVLPQSIFGNTPGLRLVFYDVAIGQTGISVRIGKYYQLLYAGNIIDPASGMVGYIFDPAWQIALISAEIELRDNAVQHFYIAGALRIPLFDTLLKAEFGLQAGIGGYQETLTITTLTATMIPLGHGSLTFGALYLSGVLRSNGFDLNGSLKSVNLDLGAPFQLSLGAANIQLSHSDSNTSFNVALQNVPFGPLGIVENATLTYGQTADSNLSLQISTTLVWTDLKQRLNMKLPEQFPLPPDTAKVTAYLSWEDDAAGGYKLVLRFAAHLSDLGSMWSFIPQAFQPEARNIEFMFKASYQNAAGFQSASTSDSFTGEVSVEMELRLPDLTDIPGADLFEYDREQWIKASLKGGMRSVNGVDEGYMEMGITEAPKVGINFPGLPQTEPPIQVELKKADFNLNAQQGSEQLAGQLQFEGGFDLRPINPANSTLPVPPDMAAHMEKLFKAAGLENTFSGTTKLDLKFKGNKAAMDLSVTFDQAKIELDLFDMMAGVTKDIAPPPGTDDSANSIDLDIDVDVRLREISLKFGSIEETAPVDQGQLGFEVALDATFAGVQVEKFSSKLSEREFSFGFSKLAVPVRLPRFPVEPKHLDILQDDSGVWNYANKWQQDVRLQLLDAIDKLKDEIEVLNTSTAVSEASRNVQLRTKRKALFEYSARQFLIDSIFAVHQLVDESNRGVYQGMVEIYVTLLDATWNQITVDTTLDFVLSDVRFVLPFQNPSDIRVEGGAHLSGFKDDDPLKPLEDLRFRLGLSPEYIYFSVEGGDPIPLPVFGQYKNESGRLESKVSLSLNHARIGYGYTKNALAVAIAGELNIAKPLADDLNTADTIGIGIRLPERSHLGFKLDLIPISLGVVKFLLPLLEFDIDLRKEYSPGISNSAACEPFWDGLQLIAPNVIRQGFKRLRFSPFFGPMPAPNYNLSFDLALGDAENGLAFVCDDFLVIVPATVIIPMLMDGMPFFNNLCTSVRLAGFGVNFNLQRPFPSMSPLALFEIFGLLADPMMPVDPNGALANTIRATIENARITLPPAVVRMFPEYGAVLSREINHTINLGTVITVVQAVAGPMGQVVQQLQQTTDDVANFLDEIITNPPQVSPAKVIALLPPELRRIDLEGSFVGFDASAAFVLLTPDEATEAFRHRNTPPQAASTAAPKFGEYPDAAWLTTYQPSFSRPTTPNYNPNASASSLLSHAPFDTFDEASLAALPTPDAEASGVLVGAEVKVLEAQTFRFLGYLFTDGSFGFISALDIEPLRVSVAGIQSKLPLQVKGRLALIGRAQGAKSYAQVTAEVWGRWEPVQDIIEMYAGSKDKPIELMLHHNGRFALKGSGGINLFSGAATVDGEVDISQTHCFVKGKFSYKPQHRIGSNNILQLSLTSTGRIGPGTSFELSGVGDLEILGRKISNIRGLISDKGAVIEGQINFSGGNWNGIAINHLRLALRGAIDLRQRDTPNFLLEGDAHLRLFGNATSVNRLEITGRGGIKAEAGDLMTYLEGKLFWQGREWLQGSVSIHSTEGIQVKGQTHFGLTLSPGAIGGVNIASLFFRINLVGTVNISNTGSFSCDLRLDWDLGINLPGNSMQTLPVASGSVHIDTLSNPIQLVNLDGFKLIPVQELSLTLPVPVIKGKGNPVLVVGRKTNKIAIYTRVGNNNHQTMYFEDLDLVTGVTIGIAPELQGGNLPELKGGRLPFTRSLTDPGRFPYLVKGEFPKLNTNVEYPKAVTTKFPIPRIASGSNGLNELDQSPRANIYSEYEVDWKNQTISVDLDSMKSSPILFGVNQNHRFYLQIGQRRYAFNGSNITN
jgi:hypothetical protein